MEPLERRSIFDYGRKSMAMGVFHLPMRMCEHILFLKEKLNNTGNMKKNPNITKYNKCMIAIVFLRGFNQLQFHSNAVYQRLISE